MLKIFFFTISLIFFSLNSAARLQILKSVTNSTYYKDSTNLINSDLLPILWFSCKLVLIFLRYGLNNLSRCWTASGRPTVSLVMGQNMLENGKISAPMLSILKKLKEGKLQDIFLRHTFTNLFESAFQLICFTSWTYRLTKNILSLNCAINTFVLHKLIHILPTQATKGTVVLNILYFFCL